MGEAQPLKLTVVVQEANNEVKPDSESNVVPNYQADHHHQQRERKWWLRVSIYALFVLLGESAATMLGRLYYNKGGQSKWIATLVQTAGFPILLPYYCVISAIPTNKKPKKSPNPNNVSFSSAAFLYSSLGLITSLVCLFHSIGLSGLPVSTYSLICATQLSFSAFFSFLFNSQRLTPYIINSLVLLTLSSVLLLFQADFTDSFETSKRTYVIGFVCTVLGSAGYGLVLSLTQFALQRVLKKESTFAAIMDMTVYVSLASTLATLAGLFFSGDWNTVGTEMEGFELGKVSYIMTLLWETVLWQVFNIGAVGLIFEVSSLFSNVISVLSLPVIPVLGVFFFHDRIDGVKVISMVLAIWGLTSYVYQHYIEGKKSLNNAENSTIPLGERRS